ncbi:hypothetical protein BGZ98_002534 [Dissophora globulifera]|nr:hypothetical protein BGZ98_002534 [Dissophora globulifera]
MPPKAAATTTADGTVPGNHQNAMNALLVSLGNVEEKLAPLFASHNSLNETLAKLDSEKRCQMELLLAYAMNTLAFINLKANGTAANNHQVMQELNRIKTYTQRLRHLTHGGGNNRSGMEVDKEAAARFIKGALAANEAADRKALEEEEAEAAANGAIVASEGTHTKFGEDGDAVASSTSIETEAKTGSASASTGNKKRVMDPFQGYEDGKKKSKP